MWWMDWTVMGLYESWRGSKYLVFLSISFFLYIIFILKNGASTCFAIFMPTLVMGNFMVLNLFLALLLNSFNSEELKNKKEVMCFVPFLFNDIIVCLIVVCVVVCLFIVYLFFVGFWWRFVGVVQFVLANILHPSLSYRILKPFQLAVTHFPYHFHFWLHLSGRQSLSMVVEPK